MRFFFFSLKKSNNFSIWCSTLVFFFFFIEYLDLKQIFWFNSDVRKMLEGSERWEVFPHPKVSMRRSLAPVAERKTLFWQRWRCSSIFFCFYPNKSRALCKNKKMENQKEKCKLKENSIKVESICVCLCGFPYFPHNGGFTLKPR